jgi:predicted nucleic acid-binding protein
LIVQSNEEERNRFIQYRERLLNVAEIVPLNTEILKEAASSETIYDLTPQDALVYASVIHHLQIYQPLQACFLNRNFKDFNTPEIVDALKKFNCRMIPRFDDGYSFLQVHTSH